MPGGSPSKMPIKAVPQSGKEIAELDEFRLIALSARKNPILPQKGPVKAGFTSQGAGYSIS